MVQYRAITKTLKAEELAALYNKNVDEVTYNALLSMAEVIAQTSPVDTGTYARNHEVGLRSGSFQADVVIDPKAPRKVAKGPPREYGLARMIEDIQSFGLLSEPSGTVGGLADPGQKNYVFRNRTTHAKYVEQRDKVYAQSRREVNNVINEALAKAGMKIR